MVQFLLGHWSPDIIVGVLVGHLTPAKLVLLFIKKIQLDAPAPALRSAAPAFGQSSPAQPRFLLWRFAGTNGLIPLVNLQVELHQLPLLLQEDVHLVRVLCWY